MLLVAGEVAAFLLLHLLGMPPLLKYLCVVIPFFLAAPALFSGKREAILSVALAFTLGADACFVLLSPPLPLLAVVLFIFVQLCYLFYLDTPGVRLSLSLAVRLGLCFVLVLLLRLAGRDDPLLLTGTVYGVFLTFNLLEAIIGRRGLFAVGLLLFFLCDLFVAGSYLSVDVAPATAIAFSRCAWTFYPFSQTLIALVAGGE